MRQSALGTALEQPVPRKINADCGSALPFSTAVIFDRRRDWGGDMSSQFEREECTTTYSIRNGDMGDRGNEM